MVRVLVEGFAAGVGVSFGMWCLQSARDLLLGFLEARWPETFGDKDDEP